VILALAPLVYQRSFPIFRWLLGHPMRQNRAWAGSGFPLQPTPAFSQFCGVPRSLGTFRLLSSLPPTHRAPSLIPIWNLLAPLRTRTSSSKTLTVVNAPPLASATTYRLLPGIAKALPPPRALRPTCCVSPASTNATSDILHALTTFKDPPMPWPMIARVCGNSRTHNCLFILMHATRSTPLGNFATCDPRWLPRYTRRCANSGPIRSGS
jgi:hypothetical protein